MGRAWKDVREDLLKNPATRRAYEREELRQELRFYRSKADSLYSEVEDGLYTVEEYHKALEKLEDRTLDLLDTYTEQREREATLRGIKMGESVHHGTAGLTFAELKDKYRLKELEQEKK